MSPNYDQNSPIYYRRTRSAIKYHQLQLEVRRPFAYTSMADGGRRDRFRSAAALVPPYREFTVEIVALVMSGAAALFLVLYVRARTALAAASARLDAERAGAAEKLALVERARVELKDTFAALSADALKSNNESFLQLARTELESKRGAIEQIVEPLRQSLTRVDSQLQQVERERAGAQARLDAARREYEQQVAKIQAENSKPQQ